MNFNLMIPIEEKQLQVVDTKVLNEIEKLSDIIKNIYQMNRLPDEKGVLIFLSWKRNIKNVIKNSTRKNNFLSMSVILKYGR